MLPIKEGITKLINQIQKTVACIPKKLLLINPNNNQPAVALTGSSISPIVGAKAMNIKNKLTKKTQGKKSM